MAPRLRGWTWWLRGNDFPQEFVTCKKFISMATVSTGTFESRSKWSPHYVYSGESIAWSRIIQICDAIKQNESDLEKKYRKLIIR